MKELKLFCYRTFKVLTKAQALELDLEFRYNLYGDAINLWNCRSIWKDHKGRIYRVNQEQ
jgi:hypothetical protein